MFWYSFAIGMEINAIISMHGLAAVINPYTTLTTMSTTIITTTATTTTLPAPLGRCCSRPLALRAWVERHPVI